MNHGSSVETSAILEPFRRDPITRFFVTRPAYVTVLLMVSLYALGACCALLDGTFYDIPQTTPPYPSGPKAHLCPVNA